MVFGQHPKCKHRNFQLLRQSHLAVTSRLLLFSAEKERKTKLSFFFISPVTSSAWIWVGVHINRRRSAMRNVRPVPGKENFPYICLTIIIITILLLYMCVVPFCHCDKNTQNKQLKRRKDLFGLRVSEVSPWSAGLVAAGPMQGRSIMVGRTGQSRAALCLGSREKPREEVKTSYPLQRPTPVQSVPTFHSSHYLPMLQLSMN
jgi:hypothetical protein